MPPWRHTSKKNSSVMGFELLQFLPFLSILPLPLHRSLPATHQCVPAVETKFRILRFPFFPHVVGRDVCSIAGWRKLLIETRSSYNRWESTETSTPATPKTDHGVLS